MVNAGMRSMSSSGSDQKVTSISCLWESIPAQQVIACHIIMVGCSLPQMRTMKVTAWYHGAWLYSKCGPSQLTGEYLQEQQCGEGIRWYGWRGPHYNYKRVELKVRPT